jgi:hypothetical protein
VSDRAQFIVLCEDLQAQVFICKALVGAGAKSGRIRRLPLPSSTGAGAGDAYVIGQYAKEVAASRRQGASASTGLVVHVDADPSHTVDQRHKQFAKELKCAGVRDRQQDEAIAELVPKRNIETWIYALDASLPSHPGAPLGEVKEYPKLRFQSDCAIAAEAFAKHARLSTNPPAVASLPSLRDGLSEFHRLPR